MKRNSASVSLWTPTFTWWMLACDLGATRASKSAFWSTRCAPFWKWGSWIERVFSTEMCLSSVYLGWCAVERTTLTPCRRWCTPDDAWWSATTPTASRHVRWVTLTPLSGVIIACRRWKCQFSPLRQMVGATDDRWNVKRANPEITYVTKIKY